jgi:hypothetical protein
MGARHCINRLFLRDFTLPHSKISLYKVVSHRYNVTFNQRSRSEGINPKTPLLNVNAIQRNFPNDNKFVANI